MDIAVFSDIHGNYVVFQSCLEYALERNIDTFILLGDYLGELPYPQKTMELIYGLNKKYTCYFIRGNKEDYWINHRNNNDSYWKEGTSSTGTLHYCYQNLKEEDIDFFSNLAISSEIKLDEYESILVCHGSPNRNNEKLLPNNEKAKDIIQSCISKYILCGHTHIQQAFEYKGKIVLNPGAVGVSLHGAGKAQFMILHSENREWSYEFISLDYNKELVIKEMEQSGLLKFAPYWSQITIHLLLTGEVSYGTVLAKAREYYMNEMGKCSWNDIPEEYWKKAFNELIN